MENQLQKNRAFLFGDAVWVSFFVRNKELIFSEECYFFLMASMRKMRMKIPLSFTLDYFQQLCLQEIEKLNKENGIIRLMIYRAEHEKNIIQGEILHHFSFTELEDVLAIQKTVEIDIIKEIQVNTNLLSIIYSHSPENIYGAIYASENDLDDVIFLNPNKRIARTTIGNLLFLQNGIIRISKQSEGAYISPLLEAFVTFVHQNKLATIEESEILPFESQKAEEILLVSEEKGLQLVNKIRNKTFESHRFSEMIVQWKVSKNKL